MYNLCICAMCATKHLIYLTAMLLLITKKIVTNDEKL